MTFVNQYVVAASGAASAFLIALSTVPTRSPLAARIDKLEKIKAPSIPERSLLIQQIVTKERQDRTQQRLLEAGWYHVTPIAMAMRGIGALGLGAAAGTGLWLLIANTTFGMLLGVFTALVAWRMPNILLARAIKKRKETIGRDLPDFLDLLSTTVEAGLALNAAMIQAAEAVRGPLRQELESTLSEIRLGRSRADALTSMAERANEAALTTMVMAIVQAEKLGSNLTNVLQELAKDTRDRRWVLAEERAAKLPVTMIIPMALFMIPSLYLMIFGPVAAELITQFR
ncbi:MAG TPA: type II secretion system F family protein [Candidatus Limnocylindria bacterium]|nr:type II secretion system F family protein [Candidatus Limnocylindria bacterium]